MPMAQMLICPRCNTYLFPPAESNSCPTCGSEFIRGRVPSNLSGLYPRKKFKTWESIVLRDPCCYCGGRSNSIEHIHPKDLGGERHAWYNKAGACRDCNSRKSNTPLLVWLAEKDLPKDQRTHLKPKPPALALILTKTRRRFNDLGALPVPVNGGDS